MMNYSCIQGSSLPYTLKPPLLSFKYNTGRTRQTIMYQRAVNLTTLMHEFPICTLSLIVIIVGGCQVRLATEKMTKKLELIVLMTDIMYLCQKRQKLLGFWDLQYTLQYTVYEPVATGGLVWSQQVGAMILMDLPMTSPVLVDKIGIAL